EGATGGGTGGTVPIISLFMTPDKIGRTWSEANNYCLNKGARLPTRDELITLFKTATSGVSPNDEMCKVHGWPLRGMCGGSTPSQSLHYWSSTRVGTGSHVSVGLDYGNPADAGDTLSLDHVACIIPGY
ncbi:hypothetical protein ACI77I_31970, partial [Pseudomonas sp. D47]|uniref:hypothetical protein n=1 Tax=Pseudomonas sp. D47 TaxID=3159447 RepID=UPI00387B2C9C